MAIICRPGCAPQQSPDTSTRYWISSVVVMSPEELKLLPGKIDTIADFEAVKRFGVQSKGGADAATAAVLAELADLIARGELEVPIAGVFAFDDVREAFRQVELRHTRGKLVLRP
jgi:NADPH:quinone reductase-like Zn-dependent oxidoreductase